MDNHKQQLMPRGLEQYAAKSKGANIPSKRKGGSKVMLGLMGQRRSLPDEAPREKQTDLSFDTLARAAEIDTQLKRAEEDVSSLLLAR